ncbi:MAG TPA: transposase [Vicinamibacterales bacterium]|nr:transposase [Vicinamibacterales bacterium]
MSPNRAPRLAGFSYVGLHQYFVTICTDKRRTSFADQGAATWLTLQIAPTFEARRFAVIAFCVMRDHVHLLLEGLTEDADLRAVVHNWKLRTAFAWKQRTGERLWQEGYYDYVLRDGDSVPGIVRYIIGNPIRGGLADDVTRYPYAGSSRYALAELADAAIDWQPPWKRRRVQRPASTYGKRRASTYAATVAAGL